MESPENPGRFNQKLGREVAIKTLPEEFAKDEERLARFEREAKLLASLNHPNIAAIYGLEEHVGTRFLVLELVEGDTLADRLKHGAIPVEESLKLALQIAEALEAAHEKGVIHRDLKPLNIKVTPDGKIKVLDFGLAKALNTTPGSDPSELPTLTTTATEEGVIMGTLAYMSPEQARGKSVDRRVDIWAFGAVIYEMLTGERAFPGEAMADCFAMIIERNPDYDNLSPGVPPPIRQLVRRCLEKDHRDRLRDIGEARVEIKQVLTATPNDASQPVYESSGGRTGPGAVPWEEENLRRQESIELYKVSGLVTVAAGIGLGAFLYFLVPDRAVYAVGLVPLLVGLTLLVYGLILAPRPTS